MQAVKHQTTSTSSSPLMTTAEVANHLRVNVKTIYRWCKTGTISGVKIGGRTKYRKGDIERMINGQ